MGLRRTVKIQDYEERVGGVVEVRGGKSTREDKEGTSTGVEGIIGDSGGKQGEGCCMWSGN